MHSARPGDEGGGPGEGEPPSEASRWRERVRQLEARERELTERVDALERLAVVAARVCEGRSGGYWTEMREILDELGRRLACARARSASSRASRLVP